MKKLGIVLKKMKCKRCGKRVEILEVIRGGSKVKSAPCKNCGHENLISLETWERGPAEVDLLDDKEVVQYIRDLLNLSHLLENGFDSELLIFIRKLKRAGYSDDRVHRFINYASYNTRYAGTGRMGTDSDEEYELGVGRNIPRALPNQGDWKEWQRIKRTHK